MNVWRLKINRAMGNTYLGLKHRKVIAQGWPHLGNLSIIARNFDNYWRNNRAEFERLIRLLACPVYPADAEKPPEAMLNLYNLMCIVKGDLVVAVESSNDASPIEGICQTDRNAWESYRFDYPDAFDYAHTVCFPVEWIDWIEIGETPPSQPARFAGVKRVGDEQAARIQELWNKRFS